MRFVLKRANSSVCRASGPLWELTHEGSRLSVFYPGKGTRSATTTFERVSVGGCRVLLGCGGAGTLVGNLRHGEVVMVEAAVRDEGESFHYLPLAREVVTDDAVVAVLEAVAGESGVVARRGKD